MTSALAAHTIGFIGAGNMGRGIAIRLASGGNELTLFDIDGEKSEAIATALGTKPG